LFRFEHKKGPLSGQFFWATPGGALEPGESFEAVFLCAACGLNVNADINAARNILAAGLAVIARGGSDNTPAREPQTHPRARRKRAASTGIPAKAVKTA
jgi:transposase